MADELSLLRKLTDTLRRGEGDDIDPMLQLVVDHITLVLEVTRVSA